MPSITNFPTLSYTLKNPYPLICLKPEKGTTYEWSLPNTPSEGVSLQEFNDQKYKIKTFRVWI